ncbi:MAG: carboxypeptidase regulatory-like domain-containing protein [Polyangia bacterium]
MRQTSAIAIITAVALFGCGFKPKSAGSGSGGTGDSAGSNQPTGTGTGGGAGGSAGSTAQSTPCQGLQCQQSTCKGGNCVQPACPGGVVTTLTGKVYDPAGRVPIYNVDVYVPNGPLPDFQDGPSCDSCADRASGHAVVRATTDASGTFTLGDHGADVPAGSNIPLVIQIGKWRRQITLPSVTACTQTALTDPNQMRLPRDQSEGHIPKMALTTGQNDALECLLRKVGISDSEFTPETGNGRINFYAGGGGTSAYASTLNGGAAFTPVHPWWDSLDNLKKYDIILHSCEGGFGSFDQNGQPMSVKSTAARQALQDYADMGGRVFASHWHVYWFEQGTPAFKSIATFNHRTGLPTTYDATIDQTTPETQALSQWMVNVGGSTTPGLVTIRQNASSRTVDTVAGGNISQGWISAPTLTPPGVLYLSATTPIPGGACGRVVFSDLHVSSGGGTAPTDLPAMPFPTGCVTTDLSPQEKVLEFMLFDIASCVISIG